MPERTDYATLIRGQSSMLVQANVGPADLPVLHQLVQLAQDTIGADGAAFVEHGPSGGQIIAASGACAAALGRAVEAGASDGPRTRHAHLHPLDDDACARQADMALHQVLWAHCEIGGFVLGSLRLYYGQAHHEPTVRNHAVLSTLASSVAYLYRHHAGRPRHGDGPGDANPGDGLAIVDGQGVVRLWSSAAEKVTGHRAADVLHGQTPFPVPAPGESGGHRLPDGRWLSVTAGEITGALAPSGTPAPSGAPALCLVTFRHATGPLPRDGDRDLFVAVTSHELRTPVTVIKGYADTLTQHWDTLDEPGRREAVRVIGARAGELARLVDRLLRASTDTNPEADSSSGPFDLVEALRDAVRQLPDDLSRRVVTDALPGSLPRAYGDRGSLATVLTELATNADKYSPPGTNVELSADADEQGVVFRVSDRGIGVAVEHSERVFERYWQADNDDHRPHSGAGLGLYLIRRIVERQHGGVSLRPRTGGGTVVEVRLPREQGAGS